MAFIFQTKIFKCPLSNRHSRPIAVIENMDMLVRNHPTADLSELFWLTEKQREQTLLFFMEVGLSAVCNRSVVLPKSGHYSSNE